MATKTSQRVAIWVIAVVMFVGTIGSFFVIILQNNNATVDQERMQTLTDAYRKDYEAYEAKAAEQGKALSAQYFAEFNSYATRVAAFNKDEVTELKTEDLKVGEGADIDLDAGASVYYIGWNPDGKIFDGSIEGESLKAPFVVTNGSVIEGWTEGLKGMKVGGVRELTIPADKAYGETGSGEDIPANTPIKFVVMVIQPGEVLKQPEIPEELMNYYGNY